MSSRISMVEQEIRNLLEKVDAMSTRMNDLAEKLDGLAEKLDGLTSQVETLAQTVAAVADDTLRACITLEEMATARRIPPAPWALATLLVELHHANLALTQGDVPDDGTSIEDRIKHLTERVTRLREEYRHGPTPPDRSVGGVQ